VLVVVLPPGVVMLIGPLVAPVGTVAPICVLLVTVYVALLPLKATLLAPLKLLPLIVTAVPTGPVVGLKSLIVGGGGGIVTLKPAPLVALPAGVVTVIGPLVAPAGTVALIWVLPPTVKPALAPLKSTFDVFWNHCPLIVTVVPTGPLVGLKPLMTGVFAGGAETLAAGRPSCAPSAIKTMSASPTHRLCSAFDGGRCHTV
jgi:hypothetical protein